MQKATYTILSLLIGLLSLFLGRFIHFQYGEFVADALQKTLEEEILVSNAAEEKHSAFGEKLDPIYSVPTRIYAKRQGSERKIIDAATVPIYLTSEGELEAPSDWNTVGWYSRSAEVGEEGNVLINGHYDDNYGRPAAFFNLKSLEVDDTVYLVDSFGRSFAYRITEIFHVSIYDKDRVDRVLESEGSSLTLITCGGIWAPLEGTYANRLVVKAQKI